MRNIIVIKHSRAILSVLLLMLFCFCRREGTIEHVVREWLGKEVVIPDDLTFTVQGDTISYKWQLTDYKIVSFIDSTGCTGCKMKLPLWENVMSRLNTFDDVSVALLMIVESDKDDEIINLSRQSGFNWPLVIDHHHLFSECNSLPESPSLRTFLLDSDNCVLAIGNPATTPDVMNLYQKNNVWGKFNPTGRGRFICSHPPQELRGV